MVKEKFETVRGGKNEMAYRQNKCTNCGWIGNKHYAYNDYQRSNLIEEREDHRRKCVKI